MRAYLLNHPLPLAIFASVVGCVVALMFHEAIEKRRENDVANSLQRELPDEMGKADGVRGLITTARKMANELEALLRKLG